MERDEHIELRLAPDDVVVLWREGIEQARRELPELVAFLEGRSEWFPEFEIPSYDNDVGVIEVEPGYFENRGFDGGAAQQRLIVFAHLPRPFSWVDDPRNEWLQMTVSSAHTDIGRPMLSDISTQDLWDALFIIARIERFGDGAIAANAKGMTAVANEIRQRLLDSPSSSRIR